MPVEVQTVTITQCITWSYKIKNITFSRLFKAPLKQRRKRKWGKEGAWLTLLDRAHAGVWRRKGEARAGKEQKRTSAVLLYIIREGRAAAPTLCIHTDRKQPDTLKRTRCGCEGVRVQVGPVKIQRVPAACERVMGVSEGSAHGQHSVDHDTDPRHPPLRVYLHPE